MYVACLLPHRTHAHRSERGFEPPVYERPFSKFENVSFGSRVPTTMTVSLPSPPSKVSTSPSFLTRRTSAPSPMLTVSSPAQFMTARSLPWPPTRLSFPEPSHNRSPCGPPNMVFEPP